MRKVSPLEQVRRGCRDCLDYKKGCPFKACPYVKHKKKTHKKKKIFETVPDDIRKELFPCSTLAERYDTKKIVALYLGGLMLVEIAERMELKPQEVDVVVKAFMKGGKNGIL